MSDTPANAFIGRTDRPAEADLSTALGPAKPVWDSLLSSLADRHGISYYEWKSYSIKAGWSLRVMRAKRTIVWLSPFDGCFQVGFILSDRALAAARALKLSAAATRALVEAQRYPEGSGVRLLIKTARDLPAVLKLAAVKLQN